MKNSERIHQVLDPAIEQISLNKGAPIDIVKGAQAEDAGAAAGQVAHAGAVMAPSPMKQEARWGVLLALPAIIGFVAFTFLPMIASAVISLTDWTIGAAPTFVGLANYKRMFTADDSFYKSLWATVYYTLGAVPLLLIVANSMLWIWLFNPDFGLLNTLTEKAGLPRSQWIFDESTAIPSLILMSVWGFGNGGAWRKLRHITLPMMTPTIFYSLVTSVIGALQVFVQAAVMTEGGPNDSTLFYIYYLYRTAFTNNEMGYASALAWVLFLVIMAVTVVLFRNSSRWVYYEAGSAR